MNDLTNLRAAIIETVDRILLMLYDRKMTGDEPPAIFMSSASALIRDAIDVVEITGQDLRNFGALLAKLEAQMSDGTERDRLGIVTQIESIYERIWHRKLDLRSMLVRTRNLGYEI
jgi:hypothetical protein